MASFSSLTKAFLGTLTLLFHTQCASPRLTGNPTSQEDRQALVKGHLTGDPPESFRLRKPVHTEEDALESFSLCGKTLADRYVDCWFFTCSLRFLCKEDQQSFAARGMALYDRYYPIYYRMDVEKGGTLLKYRESREAIEHYPTGPYAKPKLKRRFRALHKPQVPAYGTY